MKKFFTLFTALLMGSNLFAANETKILSDSVLTYNAQGEVTEAVYYTYNEMGFQTSATRAAVVGGQMTTLDSMVYILNDKNLPTERISYTNKAGALELSNKTTTEYDGNGNATCQINCMWTNNAWQNYTKMETEYNANNKPLSQITSRWMNGAWVYYNKTEATYDNDGHQLTNDRYSWNAQASEWKMVGRQELLYKNNLLDSVITYTNSSGELVYLSSNKYFYNADGKSTGYNLYAYNNGNWVLTQQQTSAYDVNGFLTEEALYYISGTGQQKQYKAEYKYDAEGHLLEFINYGVSAEEWLPENKTTYKYDKDGNESQINSYTWDANAENWFLMNYRNYFNREFTPTTIANITATEIKPKKFIENGQIVILRDGKKFNINGIEQ